MPAGAASGLATFWHSVAAGHNRSAAFRYPLSSSNADKTGKAIRKRRGGTGKTTPAFPIFMTSIFMILIFDPIDRRSLA
jgi:hypothetical protein